MAKLGIKYPFGNLHFSIDLSVDFEGLKRSNDNVIVIGTYHWTIYYYQ